MKQPCIPNTPFARLLAITSIASILAGGTLLFTQVNTVAAQLLQSDIEACQEHVNAEYKQLGPTIKAAYTATFMEEKQVALAEIQTAIPSYIERMRAGESKEEIVSEVKKAYIIRLKAVLPPFKEAFLQKKEELTQAWYNCTIDTTITFHLEDLTFDDFDFTSDSLGDIKQEDTTDSEGNTSNDSDVTTCLGGLQLGQAAPAPDSCNTCVCGEDGNIICTHAECATCGNGKIETGEECDYGPGPYAPDGTCSEQCTLQEPYPIACAPKTCTDGSKVPTCDHNGIQITYTQDPCVDLNPTTSPDSCDEDCIQKNVDDFVSMSTNFDACGAMNALVEGATDYKTEADFDQDGQFTCLDLAHFREKYALYDHWCQPSTRVNTSLDRCGMPTALKNDNTGKCWANLATKTYAAVPRNNLDWQGEITQYGPIFLEDNNGTTSIVGINGERHQVTIPPTYDNLPLYRMSQLEGSLIAYYYGQQGSGYRGETLWYDIAKGEWLYKHSASTVKGEKYNLPSIALLGAYEGWKEYTPSSTYFQSDQGGPRYKLKDDNYYFVENKQGNWRNSLNYCTNGDAAGIAFVDKQYYGISSDGNTLYSNSGYYHYSYRVNGVTGKVVALYPEGDSLVVVTQNGDNYTSLYLEEDKDNTATSNNTIKVKTPQTCMGGIQPGDAAPAPDSCNTCTCGNDGNITCTKLACVTKKPTPKQPISEQPVKSSIPVGNPPISSYVGAEKYIEYAEYDTATQTLALKIRRPQYDRFNETHPEEFKISWGNRVIIDNPTASIWHTRKIDTDFLLSINSDSSFKIMKGSQIIATFTLEERAVHPKRMAKLNNSARQSYHTIHTYGEIVDTPFVPHPKTIVHDYESVYFINANNSFILQEGNNYSLMVYHGQDTMNATKQKAVEIYDAYGLVKKISLDTGYGDSHTADSWVQNGYPDSSSYYFKKYPLDLATVKTNELYIEYNRMQPSGRAGKSINGLQPLSVVDANVPSSYILAADGHCMRSQNYTKCAQADFGLVTTNKQVPAGKDIKMEVTLEYEGKTHVVTSRFSSAPVLPSCNHGNFVFVSEKSFDGSTVNMQIHRLHSLGKNCSVSLRDVSTPADKATQNLNALVNNGTYNNLLKKNSWFDHISEGEQATGNPFMDDPILIKDIVISSVES